MNNFTPIDEKHEKKIDFHYKLKLRTAIIGFILYLLLSTTTSFKILNLIFSQFISSSVSTIVNEKNEPTFFAKLIMAFIISIILFIF
jgi:hypothetical protein